MSRYSVADAKNGLSGLIDRATAGDEVIITRHGTPVAEIKPVRPVTRQPGAGLAALRAFRESGPRNEIGSVEILRQIYEDDL
ncbi:type II toxin-antitoxin system Phd/YefM family antitoxin [Polymorphobacter fuscus]|uniref:Antitoxin n=1 Tax=Sandarakinorhabdus fusca TaxID=1439888 RepID=A0A7C9GQM2_9SPHN|nr:type II toxin-antitoxin system prevent-host-death family antitoxin [Polymorphobacter fuscus]KAB7646562.1 type II toxin-antitoxin system prevent-host-death family antitoxin [Polymorphobacter fuscus]MQT17813.1 type II toxin-antitoxin system prevent-host-death family antitoxin [Polymorphobacter fuscus]NJC09638.1 prevent-host-death family protein [Polymorphobacter fuscus]